MIIKEIETFSVAVPLTKPFKTALRTVYVAESVIVKLSCDNGLIGWGEAPPTHVITGDSKASIKGAIDQVFKPLLVGENILSYESLFHTVQSAIIGNSSAKAAINMAIYDCLAQHSQLPLYQYLGGYRDSLQTDFTVSVNEVVEMEKEAKQIVANGYRILKVKVGKEDSQLDLKRVEAIRKVVGRDITIRLDANQGWSVKEAITIIRKMEDLDLNIELIEQPVHKADLQGLKIVTDAVETPIMADESVFSPKDAFELIRTRSVDYINIKLMKSGGIDQALLINRIAEVHGIECMIGSMIETRLGITAAAHLAASQKNITKFDLDAPLLLSEDIIQGGVLYEGSKISFSTRAGLGITEVKY